LRLDYHQNIKKNHDPIAIRRLLTSELQVKQLLTVLLT